MTYTERLEELRNSALQYIKGRIDENGEYKIDFYGGDAYIITRGIHYVLKIDKNEWNLENEGLISVDELCHIADQIYEQDLNKIANDNKNQEKS